MNRRQVRLSRAFIFILAMVLLVGGVVYLRNAGRNETAASAPTATVAQLATAVIKVEPSVAAVAAEPNPTPTTAPVAAPIVVSAPTTAPVAVKVSGGEVPVGFLAKAKARFEAGSLMEARELLNGAIGSGKISDAELAASKELMGKISETVVFSNRRVSGDAFGGAYTVKSGDKPARIAANYSITPELLMRINGISDPRKLRAGATLKVIQGPFHAVVDKAKFTLDVYLGELGQAGAMYVTTFRVGLGKDDSTPTGTWIVQPQNKLKNPTYYSPRGEGVIAAGDPKNPLGSYWIGLKGTSGDSVGKASYGIHGTIAPDSIGKQESLGCIRLRNEDIAQLYEILVEGKSTVLVK